jgi:energy-coupling factor transporter ATP-binding protein EcfA2
MIRNVEINNYKSIPRLSFDLGRVTVLIGANGSGKSNILEAIALASAAAQDKLENEFLISRGIRVTEARFMRSAFETLPPAPEAIQIQFREGEEDPKIQPTRVSRKTIQVSVCGDAGAQFRCEIFADETKSYPRWRQRFGIRVQDLLEGLEKTDVATPDTKITPENLSKIIEQIADRLSAKGSGALPDYLIFAPENSALRTFQSEGQILPLGI